MRLVLLLSAFFLTLYAYCNVVPKLWENREQVRAEIPSGYVIPSKFSRVLAVGNYGLLSDFLFLKVATFIGGRGIAAQELSEGDWIFVKQSLDVITDLDPYFADPYVLAEGLLAWDARQPAAANELLKKGASHRAWDWRMPFYLGFNNFYFLKDYAAASEYIMRAAELPGSPSYLQTLAARLAYYGGKSQTALLFLRQMIVESNDPLMEIRLSKRLLALERAVVIEQALEQFKAREKRMPKGLFELVASGYLISLPQDPYGGTWGILKNGRVFSTSKFVDSESGKN